MYHSTNANQSIAHHAGCIANALQPAYVAALSPVLMHVGVHFYICWRLLVAATCTVVQSAYDHTDSFFCRNIGFADAACNRTLPKRQYRTLLLGTYSSKLEFYQRSCTVQGYAFGCFHSWVVTAIDQS